MEIMTRDEHLDDTEIDIEESGGSDTRTPIDDLQGAPEAQVLNQRYESASRQRNWGAMYALTGKAEKGVDVL
jgi:hypothetical protein